MTKLPGTHLNCLTWTEAGPYFIWSYSPLLCTASLYIIHCVSQLTLCDLYYFLFSQTERTKSLSLFISSALTTWFTPSRFSSPLMQCFLCLNSEFSVFLYILKFIFNLNDEKVEGKRRNIKFVYRVYFVCFLIVLYLKFSSCSDRQIN